MLYVADKTDFRFSIFVVIVVTDYSRFDHAVFEEATSRVHIYSNVISLWSNKVNKKCGSIFE
jgi:hypothetical protein